MNDLGCYLMDVRGRPDLAEGCFQRAADAGLETALHNRANSVVAQGRHVEAVSLYRAAIAAGQHDSWLNLGILHEDLGDRDGAREAYEQAEAGGDGGGALRIAFMLREDGRATEALAAAERAERLGSRIAGAVIACWTWCATHDPALEDDLRRGADRFPSARADLAALLGGTGRLREARRILRRGARRGEVESLVPLGNLLVEEREYERAEKAYRAAIRLGDRNARHNLGVMCLDTGDVHAGTYHLRQAAAAGDELSATRLRELEE